MKKIKNIKGKAASLLIMLSLFLSNSVAQDGAKLFKQNCNACHKVDANSIGPKLMGAKAKWEDAGEGELIYEWVTDPTGLYESGKSQMAKEIWDFNPTAMTPMAHLSREEIDAIFSFIETPPAPIVESEVAESEVVTEEPSRPLTMGEKTVISVIIILLIIAIWVTSNAKNALKGGYLNPDGREINTVSKALTGAVDIEDEDTILLDHDYDGIKELDNVLPPWWLWMFYGTIVFGVIYVAVYHVMESAPLQEKAYTIEMETAQKEVDAYKLSAGMAIDENNVELLTDIESLEAGAVIYSENCVACHLSKGEGSIGPNLTDEYWIYGGDIKTVFSTIKYGNGTMGMPSHESILNPLELQDVASFVISLPYTEGKAPQGDKK